MSEDAIATTLIEMESQALNRWAHGDPDGFLAISSPDVSYFDPFVEKRLDGLDALRALYEKLRGKVQIDHFTLLAPRVQVAGDAAILTFQFESSGSGWSMLWNTTEVYRQTAFGWRIVHSHWALNRPQPPAVEM
jgi:ketosteroid isomerase-like protein